MLSNMPALRVLWHALLSLYDETVTLVTGNLLWFALNLPLYLLLVVLCLPFADLTGPDASAGWLLVGLACLLPSLPTPAGVALGALTREAAGPDAPRRQQFWEALRARWRLGFGCFGVSALLSLAILFNIDFYATRTDGWVRLVSIVWLYALFFWLGMHVYLVPLIHHVQQPRLLDLYRRAALITLGHPGQTLLLALVLLVVALVSIAFLPVYVLAAAAYVSLVQAHAFREVRLRHGDLVVSSSDQEGQP
jgi:uncharacterized membrane protein YesL